MSCLNDSPDLSNFFRTAYPQLHSAARAQFSRERTAHTLQPTALIHEAYMRLIACPMTGIHDERAMMTAAIRSMREVLVDHARRRSRIKRGGLWRKVFMRDCTDSDTHDDTVIQLSDAIEALAKVFPRQAQVAEMKLFAGLSNDEIATRMNLAPRTTQSDWSFSRAWLKKKLHSH